MIRILIVEDDEAIANLLRMNLMKSGYECEIFWKFLLMI